MPCRSFPLALLLVLFACLNCLAQSKPDQDRYFVLIFGSQPRCWDPHRCHTWGTVVKATQRDGVVQLEQHTISWMPADFRVKLLTVRSKPGVNLDLNATIQRYLDMNCKVSVWGPYELDPCVAPDIYARTLQQIARLESGQVGYMAIDPDLGPRVKTVSDCIHAITDIDQQQGRTFYSEVMRFGERASEFIVGVLTERGRIDRNVRHEWVLEGLGLANRGLTRR